MRLLLFIISLVLLSPNACEEIPQPLVVIEEPKKVFTLDEMEHIMGEVDDLYLNKMDTILFRSVHHKDTLEWESQEIKELINNLELITPEEYQSPEFAEFMAQLPTKINDARHVLTHIENDTVKEEYEKDKATCIELMKEITAIVYSGNRCYNEGEEEIDCKEKAQRISALLKPLLKSFLPRFLKESILKVESMKTTTELININNNLEPYLIVR